MYMCFLNQCHTLFLDTLKLKTKRLRITNNGLILFKKLQIVMKSNQISTFLIFFFQAFVCSPMELVKTQMQVNKNGKGALGTLSAIIRQNGFRGLNFNDIFQSLYCVCHGLRTSRSEECTLANTKTCLVMHARTLILSTSFNFGKNIN